MNYLLLLGEIIIGQINETDAKFCVIVERLGGNWGYPIFYRLDDAVNSVKSLLPDNCAQKLVVRRL